MAETRKLSSLEKALYDRLILKGLYYLAAYDTNLSHVESQQTERLIRHYEEKVKNAKDALRKSS